MNPEDFQGEPEDRERFVKWIEDMNDEEFQHRIDNGDFGGKQLPFAMAIREEIEEEDVETEIEETEVSQYEKRSSLVEALRRFFKFR